MPTEYTYIFVVHGQSTSLRLYQNLPRDHHALLRKCHDIYNHPAAAYYLRYMNLEQIRLVLRTASGILKDQLLELLEHPVQISKNFLVTKVGLYELRRVCERPAWVYILRLGLLARDFRKKKRK